MVEYRNGETERIRRASFRDKAFFRTRGRSVEIDPRRVERIEVFSDTIEIYYSETWVRVNLHPATKDSVPPPPFAGWMKVNTVLTGVSDFGNISVSISELKQVVFRIPRENQEQQNQAAAPANGNGNGNGNNGNGNGNISEQEETEGVEDNDAPNDNYREQNEQ